MGNIINTITSSKKSNTISFIITITQDYQLKCSYIDTNNKETIIELHNQENMFHSINLTFENNNNYNFIHDLMNEPNDFKLYRVYLQGKEYSVISEVLFALLMYEFKRQIEKEFIINKTIIHLPVKNAILNSRIVTSLEAVCFKNIQINYICKPIDFDYTEQSDILE